jgi:hypothetical protein
VAEQRKQVAPTEPSQTAGYPTTDQGKQGTTQTAPQDEGPAARTVAGRDTNKDERAGVASDASRPDKDNPDRS